MGRAIMIIGAGALAVGVVIYALIECAQSQRYAVRALPKWAWVLVILLLPVVGAVLWLVFGRPRRDDAAREAQRGRGPDDDPQFLRNLEERRRQQERARTLQEWENELKRTGRSPGTAGRGSSGTGNLDTGSSRTGSSETGSSETGTSDTGVSDSGMSGTGASDSDASDTGASNTGASGTDLDEGSGEDPAAPQT